MPGRLEKDRELIKKAQQGDSHAFGDLYEIHAPAVFRYLSAHLESQMDAEDLTAEVFLKAWVSLPKYNERGVPFLAFLFRVAHNALVDHFRQNNHLEHTDPEELDGYRADNFPEAVELVGSMIEHKKMLQVMRSLRPDYKTVLTLRFISELSPQETAHAMNRSEGAVRVLQHRALIALRGEISKNGRT